MTEPSNFKTNFSGTTSIMDMLSSTSGDIPLTNTASPSVSINGRYFYLGNLLIQFTSTTNTSVNVSQNQYTIYFPISYDTKPYTILTTPLTVSNVGNTNIVVNSFNSSSVNFTPGSNDSFAMFMVIGPRPVSSY